MKKVFRKSEKLFERKVLRNGYLEDFYDWVLKIRYYLEIDFKSELNSFFKDYRNKWVDKKI